jgi:hypothetical protein
MNCRVLSVPFKEVLKISFTDYRDKRSPQEVMPELQRLIEVGGLLGHRQYLFDLFGDTTASRIESYSQPGSIALSATAWERIAARAEAQSLGLIRVKGKGELEIFRFDRFRDEFVSSQFSA